MKILYFDTETTGLDSWKHGMIEIALIAEIDGVVVDTLELKMNPVDKDIDPNALAVTGYTLKDIRSLEPDILAYFDIKEFLHKYINCYDRSDKFVPAGHNIPFDIGFLKQLFKDNGDNFLGAYLTNEYLDTLQMIPTLKWLGKLPSLANNKLETLCEALGVDLVNAHTALADIQATRECMNICKELFET